MAAPTEVITNLEHRLPEIRAEWSRRGFSFEYWIDPPGQVWRDFVHDCDELVMLIEGSIAIDVDGKAIRPALGEEVFIPHGARHTVSNVGDASNRWCFGYKVNR